MITPPCPYCGSIVNPPIIKDDLTHCEFCDDYMHCSQGGKEKSLYTILKPTNDSWKIDETYVKVKEQWMYLYRAVDSEGNTIDFYLSKTRNKQAAKRFFKKALAFSHVSTPRATTVDKKPAYPIAIQELKEERKMPQGIQLRQIKYLNNIVEQDHRFIKKPLSTIFTQFQPLRQNP